MAHPIISIQLRTLVIVLVLSTAMQRVGAHRRISVSLLKKSAMQNGDLGQPLTSYFARVDVGFWKTTTKTFNMLVDVNASESWLPIHSDMAHPKLNHKSGYENRLLSWGSKAPKDTTKVDFKGCELEGKAWRDQFTLKDVTGSAGKVWWLQSFLVMSTASNDKFAKYIGVDGVLAPQHMRSTRTGYVLRELLSCRLIDDFRFALALDADIHTELGGELTLGEPNPLKFTGNLRYHPVVSRREWAVGLQSVLLGTIPVGSCSEGCMAVLSTTINDIYAPTSAIQDLLKLLGFSDVERNFNSGSLYEIDCMRRRAAPSLTFVIDGANYTLPPKSYIKEKTANCYVALLSNESRNKWELGTAFLSNYYAVFEINTQRIALGTRVHELDPN